MRRWLLTIAGLILVAGLAGAAWLVIMAGPQEPAAEGSDVGYVISPLDRTVGNRKAPVVLIEYAAPVCPHCAAFEIQDFPSLKAKYIDTGKVFYVFRVFPIRPGDGPAEKLAGCLPAENYLAFIDLLFRNQPKWDADEYPGADIHAGLIQMGRIAGMSSDQVERCINSNAQNDRIDKVAADGEARYHISGTPTFVVDGRSGPAGEEFGALQKRLDAALAKKGAAQH